MDGRVSLDRFQAHCNWEMSAWLTWGSCRSERIRATPKWEIRGNSVHGFAPVVDGCHDNGRTLFAEMAESPFRQCVWEIQLKAQVTVKNAVTESGKNL